MAEKEPKQIFSLMGKILNDVENIQKTRRNNEQGYAFRGIEQVYEAVHPLFAKYGVFILPRVLEKESSERVTAKGTILRFTELKIAYDFCAPDGSMVTAEVVGEAMDSGDKSSNKAMSQAQKYCLLQAFLIPTGDQPDADATTPDELRPAQRCPECGGPMWDNRDSKRNPKAPDYKCKNKNCNGAIWEDADRNQPEPPRPLDSPEVPAVVTQLRDHIKAAAQALNESGDVDNEGSPKWTVQSINVMSKEHFGAPVAQLDQKGLEQLAEMFSQRLEGFRKNGDQRRKDIIASIQASAQDGEIEKYLKEHHEGKVLDHLTTAQLAQMDVDISVPF